MPFEENRRWNEGGVDVFQVTNITIGARSSGHDTAQSRDQGQSASLGLRHLRRHDDKYTRIASSSHGRLPSRDLWHGDNIASTEHLVYVGLFELVQGPTVPQNLTLAHTKKRVPKDGS